MFEHPAPNRVCIEIHFLQADRDGRVVHVEGRVGVRPDVGTGRVTLGKDLDRIWIHVHEKLADMSSSHFELLDKACPAIKAACAAAESIRLTGTP